MPTPENVNPEWRSLKSLNESFTDEQLQVDALRRLIDLSDLGLARCTVDGRILYLTPRFSHYLRQPADDLIARSVRSLIPEDVWPQFEEHLKSPQQQHAPVIFVPTLTPEGEVPLVWTIRRVTLADTTQEVHMTVRPARVEDTEHSDSARSIIPFVETQPLDSPRALTGRYIDDITIWEMEQTTRLRGSISQSGAWVMDLPTNTIVWSESAFATLGVPLPAEGAPHSMGFEQWVHPDDLQRTAELLYERFVAPGRFEVDVRGIRGDGQVRNIHAVGETYKTKKDLPTPDRAYGVFVDQTEELLSARTLNMALRVDGIFARSRDGHPDLFNDLVEVITSHGGFSYAAFHQRNDDASTSVKAYSGSNRFMATEEAKRVAEVFLSGKPSHITDSTRGVDLTLATFFPIIVRKQVRLVCVVWSEEPGQFTDRVLQYLADFSVNLGSLIEGLEATDRTRTVLRTLMTMFGAAIESHTPFEAGRHPRIASLSKAIAQDLNMDEADVFGVEMAASIYDMGMLWIPDRLTMAHPGSLTEDDKTAAQRHASIGQSIAGAFKWPWPIPEVMGQHHEHWDGTGYPEGLAGEEIALAARIVAVAATFEALTRQRPYQTSMAVPDVVRSLQAKAGTVFDPKVIDALVRVIQSGFVFDEQPASSTLRDADREYESPSWDR